ncbi:hypothetical protein BT63DRAFT_58472 [Microthyrium microscopicum]|uniref:Uncharacterized protein n=1 Tax=Microthyrium microscopicum TaxID=703497 RepID=A0A6A6U4Q5_9PEZI|nr:hypothetical protein BT63DRAFT_58472 [Microthyrium microscopicum]
MKPRQMLKLQTYRLTPSGPTRLLTWTGTTPTHTLEHHLPSSTPLPYTLHASLSSLSPTISITIPGPSRIRWLKSTDQSNTPTLKLDESRTDVSYSFVTRADALRFQEDIRDAHLLGAFDIAQISSTTTGSRGSSREAVNQDVKIWCTRDERAEVTLSYYADQRGEHVEWGVREFISVEGKGKRCVVLTLARAVREGGKTAFWKRKGRDEMVWESVGSGASSVRSTSTAGTVASVSSFGSVASSVGAGRARWMDKVQSLTVQFGPEAKKKGEEDDYVRFVRLLSILVQRDSEGGAEPA